MAPGKPMSPEKERPARLINIRPSRLLRSLGAVCNRLRAAFITRNYQTTAIWYPSAHSGY